MNNNINELKELIEDYHNDNDKNSYRRLKSKNKQSI